MSALPPTQYIYSCHHTCLYIYISACVPVSIYNITHLSTPVITFPSSTCCIILFICALFHLFWFFFSLYRKTSKKKKTCAAFCEITCSQRTHMRLRTVLLTNFPSIPPLRCRRFNLLVTSFICPLLSYSFHCITVIAYILEFITDRRTLPSLVIHKLTLLQPLIFNSSLICLFLSYVITAPPLTAYIRGIITNRRLVPPLS